MRQNIPPSPPQKKKSKQTVNNDDNTNNTDVLRMNWDGIFILTKGFQSSAARDVMGCLYQKYESSFIVSTTW